MSFLDNLEQISLTDAVTVTISNGIRNRHPDLKAEQRNYLQLMWGQGHEFGAEQLTKFGTNAKKIVLISRYIALALNEIEPGCMDDVIALVPELVLNDDGTVTLAVAP